MSMWIYIYIYIYMYVCVCVYIYIYIYICVCVCVWVYKSIYSYIWVYKIYGKRIWVYKFVVLMISLTREDIVYPWHLVWWFLNGSEVSGDSFGCTIYFVLSEWRCCLTILYLNNMFKCLFIRSEILLTVVSLVDWCSFFYRWTTMCLMISFRLKGTIGISGHNIFSLWSFSLRYQFRLSICQMWVAFLL